jgi:hypothetical protein
MEEKITGKEVARKKRKDPCATAIEGRSSLALGI